MSLIWVMYHGEVDIAYWEYAMGFVCLLIVYVYFARQKNMLVKEAPEYRHFMWGLFAKVFGGVAFSLIYFYYYAGGDTIMYFYSAVSLSKMAAMDFMSYLDVVTGPNDWDNLARFNDTIGYPFAYVYFDPRSYFFIRVISPLVYLTFNSYLITTLVLSSVSYIGVWRCYRTFVSYYPSLMNKFAIAFLYMPSVVFWGSAIMKDTMTFSAACWWIHCVDEVFFKRRRMVFSILGLAVSATIMVVMKPYIFMAVLPISILWVLYFRVSKIRSAVIRFVLLPISGLAMFSVSIYVLTSLGDKLDKFSLDSAISTIQTTQSDMIRSEQYGNNFFDVGKMDGTWTSVLSKFPVATNAALFRPYLWEAHSMVVALSALENSWLLGFTLLLLWRTRVWFFLRCVIGNPLVLVCIAFSLLFGFTIGVSTPNFGALVRFKIPLVPLYVSGLYIIDMLNRRRLAALSRGKRFDIALFMAGEPRSAPAPVKVLKRERSNPFSK
ncbi:MAG: hypothetical protein ABI432_13970 [Flavobacteriales bacterium]